MRSITFSKEEIFALKKAVAKKHLIQTLLIDHVDENELPSFFISIVKIISAPSDIQLTIELNSDESNLLRDLTHNFLISEGLTENSFDGSTNPNELGIVLENISDKLFE